MARQLEVDTEGEKRVFLATKSAEYEDKLRKEVELMRDD
jgi:hypothetical protein